MNTNLHILTNVLIPDVVLASNTGNAVLLLREAVHLLLQPLPVELTRLKIYALEEDLVARGLPITMISDQVELIDYARFVELTIEYNTSTSW